MVVLSVADVMCVYLGAAGICYADNLHRLSERDSLKCIIDSECRH